jgi:LmbE family N-acetylglucosaminyl deacetylase
MRFTKVFFCGFLILISNLNAQSPKTSAPSDIYHAIEKLNFLGTALYVAAHPDDENTRLISYLSNNVKARTAYLSLTRGDGGQNLIGPELRELLGVLRTQELLAARRVDGGEQFFTRAVDFGYSKHPKETLGIWNKEAILGDVVRTIRKFKPDIIINRFDHRSPGSTHGHHTSSAMLSLEAFDLSGQKDAYPDQLTKEEVWQPKRIFFNTSWWFYGSQEEFEAADKTNLLVMDTGVFYPMLGKSNNEIASLASSQHLCQGFGRLTSRGSEQEYVELLKGDLPKDKSNLFEGINTTWSRVDGGAEIGNILGEVEKNFNFKDPTVHIPALTKAYALLQNIEDEHWKVIKSEELKEIISATMGLFLESAAQKPSANPGETVNVDVTLLNRSEIPVLLSAVSINGQPVLQEKMELTANVLITKEIALKIPEDTGYTSPYWLEKEGTLGTYTVENKELIGKPETPHAFTVSFQLEVGGEPLTIDKPVVYKYAKPDKGERYQPFEIIPQATASVSDKVIIFSSGDAKEISVKVKAHTNGANGEVTLPYQNGWTVEPAAQAFYIAKKGDEQTLIFTVTPPSFESEAILAPEVLINGKNINKELVNITYDHIPSQTVLMPAKSKIVRLDIEKAGEHIGYIMGAGDDVPKSLEQIGYTVDLIDPNTITKASLDRYDAVVMGIRAYNVLESLKFKQRFILDYAKNGGTVVVQYNTASRWGKQFENIAPYPLEISRDRVTDENSEVRIIAKDHSLMNFPNKIAPSDFNGWVQERGLYFPDTWDKAFTPVLEMHDADEDWKKGSLLVAPHGKGHYIYTGLSFFRELPAGVPGAYKLFSNMISIGKDKIKTTDQIRG